MTISIKHKFVNPKSDTADGTVTRASNWNDEHELTLAQNRVLGRISAANGPVEELTGDQIRTISDTTQAGVVVGVNTRTAPYTLVASDRGKIIEMNVAGANTVTIPNETGIGGVNFPIGTLINVVQLGTGQTTLLPAAGVTARSVTGGLSTSTRYGSLILYKRASNDWFVIDQTSAYLDGRVDTLETIAGGLADVGTVATDIASVTTVAGSIGNVNIAATNVADINNFADVYQGGNSSDPTLRNSGSTLQTGDLYYNTANNRMRVYETGTGWIDYEATAQTAATTATTQAGIATAQATTATTQANAATSAKTAAEAARDASIAASTAAQAAGPFSTVALGLSGTTNGKYFGVKQANGDAIDIYLNNAGAAVYQQTRPYGIGDQYELAQIAERNISLYPPYPFTPIVDIHSVDQFDTNNRYYKSRTASGRSGNIFPLNSGYIPNATTQAFANGPGGALTAARFTIVNNYIGIASTAFPAGTNYTCRLKVKSAPGAGTLNFQIGHFTVTMITVTCDESAWVTVSWTATGGTNFPILIDSRSGTTTTIDILVDEIQVYEGAVTLPAFNTEVREASAYPISSNWLLKGLDLAGRSGVAINTVSKGRANIPLPSFPANTVFTEGTMIACIRTTDTTAVAAKILGSGANEGEWDIGVNLGRPYGRPALLRGNAGVGSRIAGTGYQIIASRFKAGEQAFFFRKIKVETNANTLTVTKKLIGFCEDPIDGGGTLTTFLFKGDVTVAMLFDKWLNDTQMTALVDNIKARHALTGEPTLQPYNYWIAEGDSITEQAGAGGTTYYQQYFNTFRSTWFGRNIAVSGSTHANAVTRQPWVVAACQAAVSEGSRPIVSYFMGANGIPTQQQIIDYGTAIRATGAKFIMCTILPKASNTTWETDRLAYNTMLRNNPGWYDALADFGASPTIGAFGAPTARVYYYDDVHLNTAGETEALAIIQPLLLSLAL